MRPTRPWELSGGTFRAAVIVIAGGTIAWEAVTRSQGFDSAAELCMLASAIAVLVSSVFYYVRWHVDLEPSMGWLVSVTAAFAVQQLNWFMLIVDDPPHEAAQTAWAGAFQVLVTIGLGVLLVRGDRLPVRYDPLAVGTAIGLVLILLRIVVLLVAPPASSAAAYAVTVAALVVVGLWNARMIVRAHILGADLRGRIALAAILLAIGQTAAMATHAPVGLLLTSIVANTAGGALVVGTAAAVARTAVIDDAAAVRVLRRRLEAAEMDLHTDQAQLHEIRATLAGISCATELVRRAGISQARRDQLQAMTASELQRLQRLVSTRSVGAPAPVELDATLRPIVLRHQTDGLPVTWEPSGHVAIARADDVAEIINVLLSNARRHAGRRPVKVTLSAVGRTIELTVRDTGPGVPPAVRSRLFQWGALGPGSPGEGVGLATAQLLAGELGGDLRLDDAGAGTGATFVLSLPAAEQPVLQDGLS